MTRHFQRFQWAVISWACLACNNAQPTSNPAPGASKAPSPNASILPAPLESRRRPSEPPKAAPTASGSAGRRVGVQFDKDGNPIVPAPVPQPAVALRPDRALPVDRVKTQDVAGVVLEGEWIWPSQGSSDGLASATKDAAGKLRDASRHRWTVWLSDGGRMRIVFHGTAFPIPLGSELRARSDRLGHLFVFPNTNDYRVVPQGGLRALFGDRRLDPLPLVDGKTKLGKAGPTVGEIKSKSRIHSSDWGKVTLASSQQKVAAYGAQLLCRSLLELVGVQGGDRQCPVGKLPVAASYTWAGGGKIRFAVTSVKRRTDLPALELLFPPPGGRFSPTAMPHPAAGVFHAAKALATLRNKAHPPKEAQEGAPGEGILAHNQSRALRYLSLDGVPVAWIAPGKRRLIIGPKAGTYRVAWRSFLGEVQGPVRKVQLPIKLSHPQPDEKKPKSKPAKPPAPAKKP